MRIVDLRQNAVTGEPIKAHQVYSFVPQPMYIYHSKEELQMNVLDKEEAIVINDWVDFGHFVQKSGLNFRYDTNNRWLDMQPFNIWLKTEDTKIPDFADYDGTIYYKTREVDGKKDFIPTDGCYIRLFFITPTSTMFVLFTSAGINAISMTRWELTAAVRNQFYHTKDPRRGVNRYTNYQDNLAKLLRKKKPDVRLTKVAYTMMNPAAETFLDLEKTIKAVYGTSLKAKDRLKLLQSPAFKEALMSTIKVMFPSLPKQIQTDLPPQKLTEFLADAMKISKQKEDVGKMLDVFNKIVEIGYTENTPVNPLQLPYASPQGLEDPLAGKEIEASYSMNKIQKLIPNAEELSEEEIEAIRQEQDYPNSFVIRDIEVEEIPELPEEKKK